MNNHRSLTVFVLLLPNPYCHIPVNLQTLTAATVLIHMLDYLLLLILY